MKNIYKFLLIALQALLVSVFAGCDTEETHILTQIIKHEATVTYVDNSQDYDTTELHLTSTTSGATVYVQSDLSKLIVSGSNSLFYFSEGVSVKGCEVSGNDNTAIFPEGFVLSCEVTGVGNTGFDDA
ncbi:MAG: hypothetical protein GY781_02685 [Gammaproteobacteria bacterium]|nr:hypothetical protein [Gammaproteobacteria bacterium]